MAWVTDEYMEKAKALHRKMNEEFLRIILGIGEKDNRPDKNVKLAFVVVGGSRIMVGLDTVTMEAYKLRDDAPAWEIPLTPVRYDYFERWCTGFDV